MSRYLSEELGRRYPDAAIVASTDPLEALRSVPDVAVRFSDRRPTGACALGGVYDGNVTPAGITIHRSANEKRNSFTALHELGHHLLWSDDDWQLDILPGLGEKHRIVEEKIVNAFAALLLIPDSAVEASLGAGVTACGIRDLSEASAASPTSCCVRALNLPGERLVMLASLDGTIWYSDSNGIPLNPGKRVHQPSLVLAAERAMGGGSFTLAGGEGIRYTNGWADTNVAIEVALHGELIVAVVTSVAPDPRLRDDSGWCETCTACYADFLPSESPRQCARCGDWKCPECHGCQCTTQPPTCQRCYLTLSVAEAALGLTTHEECS